MLPYGQCNKYCRGELSRDHPLYDYAVTGMGLKFRIIRWPPALRSAGSGVLSTA